MRWLLILLLVMGCGDIKRLKDVIRKKRGDSWERYKGKGQDSDIATHIDSFEAIYGEIGDNPVVFANLGDGVAGQCYYDGVKWEIEIDRTVWDSIDDPRREQLVWHELGHCVLKRYGHTNGSVVKGGVSCPISVMRSMAFNQFESDNCYVPFNQDYIDELF